MANNRLVMYKFGQGIFTRDSVYNQLDKIQTPTLVIVGAEDVPQPPAKAERIAKKIPGAKFFYHALKFRDWGKSMFTTPIYVPTLSDHAGVFCQIGITVILCNLASPICKIIRVDHTVGRMTQSVVS
ncbi:MAG: hypothetical protein WCB15_09915 [Desulfobacterales bacterium]